LFEKFNFQNIIFCATELTKANLDVDLGRKFNKYLFKNDLSFRQSFDLERSQHSFGVRASSAYPVWFNIKFKISNILWVKFLSSCNVFWGVVPLTIKSIPLNISLLFVREQLLNDLAYSLKLTLFSFVGVKQKESLDLFLYNNNYNPQLLFFSLTKKMLFSFVNKFLNFFPHVNFLFSIERIFAN